MNTSYDLQLNELDIYKLHPTLLPFVGEHYETYRVLQIGESHYINQLPDTEKYNIEYFDKWWNESCQEVLDDSPGWADTRAVVTNYINEPRSGNSYTIFTNFIKSFSKVVLEKEISSISMEDKSLYNYISFMNFFQMPSLYEGTKFWDSLEISAKKISKPELAGAMWDKAARVSVETIDKVIDILNPRAIIFTSISAGNAYKDNGGKCQAEKIIFTSHPGYPFTWWKELKSLNGKTGKEVLEQELSRIYKQ